MEEKNKEFDDRTLREILNTLEEKEQLSAKAISIINAQLKEINSLYNLIEKRLTEFHTEFDERLIDCSKTIDNIKRKQKWEQ